MAVKCGAAGDELTLTVTLAGDRARELAAALKPGSEVRAHGSLRTLKGRSDSPIIEVMADSVELITGRTG
jgi:primosomal replication protein N